MAVPTINCPVCGYIYDPTGRNACGSCPLNSGCEMVCCPNCGHSTIDPARSGLVRLITKIFSPGSKAAPAGVEKAPDGRQVGEIPGPGRPLPANGPPQEQARSGPLERLDRIAPGARVRVEKFDRQLAQARQARLQAYGIVPGFWIEVIQQSPVTIIKIDHLELALEKGLAAGILVGVLSE